MPGPKAQKDCPGLEQFQRLVLAQLSAPDRDALLLHLEGCDSCAARLNSLPEQKVRDRDLVVFKGCKNLTHLDLWETRITDDGLACFKDCTNLKFLKCERTGVTHLTPLQDLKLTHLNCKGTAVKDLSPLRNMNLEHLEVTNTQVSDLSPVMRMNLTYLSIANTRVSDLTLLKNMKLTTLICDGAPIGDLLPLEGMKLTTLICQGTRVTDLSPLKGMPLEVLTCNFTPERDAEILRSIKTLKSINRRPAAEFWKDVPAKELLALRRDTLPPEALALAGDGDPKRAPACLVGVLGEAQPIHSGSVWALAFSRDGRWLASASDDGTILLRDSASGQVKRILKGQTGLVVALAFSKDDRALVSFAYDGTLRLWPVEKEEKPTLIATKLGSSWEGAMALSPDGRFLAATGPDGRIKLWKWGAWDRPTDFAAPAGWGRNRALAFSPDGELLASGGHLLVEKEEGTRVRLYATADGTLKKTMQDNTDRVMELAFSHDGKHLAGVRLDGGNGRVWEVASGKTVMELTRPLFGGEPNDAQSLAWGPDDRTLAVGSLTRVTVYNFPGGMKRTLWFASAQHVRCVRISPDGKLLAASGENGDVHVWDTTSWKLKYLQRGHPRNVRSVAVSPDGREVLSLGEDLALLRWQLSRPREPVVQDLTFRDHYWRYIPSISYGQDGKTWVLPGVQMIAVRNVAGEKQTVIPTAPLQLHNPAVSPDGKSVAGGGDDGCLHLWDLALGRAVHRFPHKARWWTGSAFSRDGKLLASCNEGKKQVTVWNAASANEVSSWTVPSVASVSAFHPYGKVLAVGGQDGSILLHDAATGKRLRALGGHPGPIRALKFTPDGNTLVSSGHDGVIRLWNPQNVRAREVIPLGPTNRPLTFDLDPSGRYLFAAGAFPVIFILRLP
jgi:WD40 repeat protein